MDIKSITEMLEQLRGFFNTAPTATACIVIVVLILRHLRKYPIVIPGHTVDEVEFVKKKECHSHIDQFRDEMNNNFGSMHEDVKGVYAKIDKVQEMLFNHVNKGD